MLNSDNKINTLLQCLVTLAQHHGLCKDPESALKELPLPIGNLDTEQLVRIAAHLGLQAQALSATWEDLPRLEQRCPVLIKLSNGNSVLLIGMRVVNHNERQLAILDPLASQQGIFWLGQAVFNSRWQGELFVITPDVSRLAHEKLVAAIALQHQGQFAQAIQGLEEVLALAPNHPAALYSLAVIALHRSNPEGARQITEQAVRVVSDFAPLWFAHATALQTLGLKLEALDAYNRALQLQPNYPEVLVNSGVLLRELLRHQEAIERFQRVLQIEPNSVSGLANYAILLTDFNRSEQAISLFERLLTLNPDYDYGLGLLFYERLHICDWRDFENLSQQIIQGVRAGRRVCKTLAFMAVSDSAEDQFKAAKIFAASHLPTSNPALWRGESYHHKRLKIAYVSPDLREHPVGHLMAGIFEHHDKNRFEIIGISLGANDGSKLQARIRNSCDLFIDAQAMGSYQIAQKMRELEIDVAIDLAGYTADARLDLFTYRPAPVQVGYLGYPGTLASDYLDYLIADRQIIPEAQRKFYHEQIAYLPNAYLPIDSSIQIPEQLPTRQECGLPATGMVFCSFSHDYKITPPVFTIWMRLLAQIPGSVLWLMARAEAAQRNLQLEAKKLGIDPVRLIFASRVPRIEDHLARYRQADLFLDTYPYNAHTTAADALLAGLPVLTRMGDSLPSRVAGSLLHACGLPELITYSLEEYEKQALLLANNPDLLQKFKNCLKQNRATHQFFDTRKTCRNLENLYLEMWRTLTGQPEPSVVINSNILTRTLDLGCGTEPKNPFNAQEIFGIDLREDVKSENIRCIDLALDPIPFPDQFFDSISAYDFLEHIPRILYSPKRRYPFVELMNEIYRVLKDNGLFVSVTPAYPQAAAFQDPTHVNIITELTFPLYFDSINLWAVPYGFKGKFLIRSQEWQGIHLLTIMQKI